MSGEAVKAAKAQSDDDAEAGAAARAGRHRSVASATS